MKKPKPQPTDDDRPRIRGARVEEIDEQEVYENAVKEWHKIERLVHQRKSQVVEFKRGPVCVVFVGDVHLGNSGVDYPRVFEEAQIIRDTPGMHVMTDGDLLDNFIIPKLMSARYNAKITVAEEWALVRKYLKVIAPKLLASVSGNHESWHWLLSAVDYFADVLKSVQPDAIYDTDDAEILIKVGKGQFPVRMRHHWQGQSIYNPTHGVERASQFDGGFRIGVAAHTHKCGVIRESVSQGETIMSILCGSYKRVDDFARRKGFPHHNNSTAISVILFDDGSMVGVGNLQLAAKMMRRLR